MACGPITPWGDEELDMRSTAFSIARPPRGREVTRLVLFVCLGTWVTGCGGDSDPAGPGGSDGAVDPVTVSGAVQKGPFILGAQVQVNVLDSVGNPTGTVFNTTTTSDKGEFSVSVSPSVVELVTDGFYYNEGSWSLSAAPISMRALTEVTASGPQTAYVNVLTHMSQRRALSLYAGGASLDSAISQAEGEVRAVFPALVAPPSLASGTDMNLLGGDNPSNAYLLALSCIVSQAALNASDGTDLDAQLQQLMNTIAGDLEADGVVDPDFIVQKIDQAGILDPYECVASLQQRLDDIGDTTTVLPDPLQAFDWDRDGIPNSMDSDADGDGFATAGVPVTSLAVAGGPGSPATQLVVVKADSGHALDLLGPPPAPAVGGTRYSPSRVDELGGSAATDIKEAVAALGIVVIRRGGGAVHYLPVDAQLSNPVTGITGAAVSLTVTPSGVLLVIDDNGDVTRHVNSDPNSPPTSLSMTAVARVAGADPNYVYLDTLGAVRIVEGATVTDVSGFGTDTIIDVAADVGTSAGGYIAISSSGALYRFTAAAPTAVLDPVLTGASYLSMPFALTAEGVWDLSEGAGPFQVSDVAGLTSFYGPVTWGESGILAYVATDSAGNVLLIDFSGDLSINSLFRQVYVPG